MARSIDWCKSAQVYKADHGSGAVSPLGTREAFDRSRGDMASVAVAYDYYVVAFFASLLDLGLRDSNVIGKGVVLHRSCRRRGLLDYENVVFVFS